MKFGKLVGHVFSQKKFGYWGFTQWLSFSTAEELIRYTVVVTTDVFIVRDPVDRETEAQVGEERLPLLSYS